MYSEPSQNPGWSTGLAIQAVQVVQVDFSDRRAFSTQFLHQSPHGGLIVATSENVYVEELVTLRIRLIQEAQEEAIKGLVLWVRGEAPEQTLGVGFLASEVEKRERLLVIPEKRSLL